MKLLLTLIVTLGLFSAFAAEVNTVSPASPASATQQSPATKLAPKKVRAKKAAKHVKSSVTATK